VGQGFGYGLWDGVTGIFTQPVKGMQKEGLPGLWKGFARGVGGAAFKPAAGKIYSLSSQLTIIPRLLTIHNTF